MTRLSDKVAAVTGVASENGLGFAIAEEFCRQGAVVCIGDRDAKGLERCGKALQSKGHRIIARALDVTRGNDWAEFAAAIAERFGQLDILVNNAGISKRSSLETMTGDVWSQVIEVNLTGAFLGCQTASKMMRGQMTGGSIVNIASISALAAFPGSCAYGASKGGLRQLSKVVAFEGADCAIRCNTIFPGMIATDLLLDLEKSAPEQISAQTERIPLGRIGKPSDVAKCAVFLASDESRYMTGGEITVDGGYLAQ